MIDLLVSNRVAMKENTFDCILNRSLDDNILIDIKARPKCQYPDLSTMSIEIDNNSFSNTGAIDRDTTDMRIRIEEIEPFNVPIAI